MGKIIDYIMESMPSTFFWKVYDGMKSIKEYCDDHPTCKGCGFMKKHEGCIFRGKSPKEW
jgi:hypothetical protein